MTASLKTTLQQRLAITPELRQAISFLQLPTLELNQKIQEYVDSNPLLDLFLNTEILESELPTKNPIDTHIGIQYEAKSSHFETCASPANLKDHLHWQLNVLPLSSTDLAIAEAIIDAVDEKGFLTLSLEELQSTLMTAIPQIHLAEIVAIQHLIQHFDPLGCASNTLAEVLLIQLEQWDEDIPLLQIAKKIIAEDLESLGKHQYAALSKKHAISMESLQEILDLIKQLNPRPGEILDNRKPEYIIPDLFVKKMNQQWHVSLNQNLLPHLSINEMYRSLTQKVTKQSDYLYLKDNLRQAYWLLQSLKKRQETLFQTANFIVKHQQAFFESGCQEMRPLTLHTVAHALGMHTSTISRVTTQKYMNTPHGIFELKDFFTSGLNKGMIEKSSLAVQSLMKEALASEEPEDPLSDQALTHYLSARGIRVARRTVTKYRKELQIPASSQRKQFINH